jgi:hypothetical protein
LVGDGGIQIAFGTDRLDEIICARCRPISGGRLRSAV